MPKNNKTNEKTDWKKLECGAAWKKSSDSGREYYFIKVDLRKAGLKTNKTLLMRGYKNDYTDGNNPPTMKIYITEVVEEKAMELNSAPKPEVPQPQQPTEQEPAEQEPKDLL